MTRAVFLQFGTPIVKTGFQKSVLEKMKERGKMEKKPTMEGFKN